MVEDGSGETTVLVVVEDEPDMRLLIRTVLAAERDLQVAGEAADADTAIRAAAELQPALVVLDHGLDGSMTGLEAAPLLRAAAPHAKILLFTAYDMAAQVRAEPAIDAFLRKDRIGDLLVTVRRLLGREAA
jgi:two-component system nitrate/nitrite response regulator NarL